MRLILVVLLLAAAATFGGARSARAQSAPVYHGALSVRRATGGIDKEVGIASLRVKNWLLRLTPDTNGIAPDREPIIIAIGENERLVIPAGQMRSSRKGKRFFYKNSKVPRGVRTLEILRLKPDASGLARYRLRFSLVGIDLSSLVIQFPICTALAVIVGDDDGFTGIDLDRPGGFGGSKVRVLGPCTDVADWPWV